MKNLIAFLLILNSSSFNVNAQISQQWERRYNGTANSEDFMASSALDKSGNLIVTGSSKGIDTEYDYLTIKYKSNGDTLWTRRFNGIDSVSDEAHCVTTDNSGNILVTGESSQKISTIKYDSSGNLLWERKYYESSFWCTGISVLTDDSGNVYVLGYAINISDKYITIKYDPQGIQQWVRGYLSPDGGWSTALSIDDSANVYVTGISSLNGNNDDITVIKYNSSGDSLWVRRYDSGLYDYPSAIAVDKDGNVYVTGECDGSPFVYWAYKYLTIKFDKNGNLIWVRKYDGLGVDRDFAFALAVDDAFNVYVTGESSGAGSVSGFDYVTIKYNSNGDSLWVRRYNGTGDSIDIPNSIALDSDGNVYVAGSSYDIRGQTVIATIKYSSSGDLKWQIEHEGFAGIVKLDSTGIVYVLGTVSGISSGPDFLTIKYLDLVGINPVSEEINKEYFLSQNYPNPFNPVTIINYELNVTGFVQLKVYDVLGNEVSSLVNKNQIAGKYRVEFDGSNLSSGVYFYKIVTGKFSDTKRMILLK